MCVCSLNDIKTTIYDAQLNGNTQKYSTCMFSQQLSDKYQKTREHDRFAIYSHAPIAMTGLDRTKLSTTPSQHSTSYPFFLQQKICWLMKSNTRNNIIYYLKTPTINHPDMASIFTCHFYPSNWAKASGNCFAAHWATSAKGGATSMDPATWNHGKNHGSHGTKARILATGVIFKDLPTYVSSKKATKLTNLNH